MFGDSLRETAFKFAAVVQNTKYEQRKAVINQFFKSQVEALENYYDSRKPENPHLSPFLDESEREVMDSTFLIEVMFTFLSNLLEVQVVMNTSPALISEYVPQIKRVLPPPSYAFSGLEQSELAIMFTPNVKQTQAGVLLGSEERRGGEEGFCTSCFYVSQLFTKTKTKRSDT